MNKRSYLARINPYSRMLWVCHTCAIQTSAEARRGASWAVRLFAYPRSENRKPREARKQQARSHRSTATSLHPFVSGGTGELRLALTDGPLGGLSIGQQTEDYAISAGRRLSTSCFYKTTRCQRAQLKHRHQGLALCKIKRHRALLGYHGGHRPSAESSLLANCT